MYPNNDYIYDASVALEQLTGLNINIESRRNEYDGIIDINGHAFTVEAKNELRKENKGFLFAHLDELKTKTKRPTLIIAKYITNEVALELREKEINYLDAAGNCFIKHQDLVLYIIGQKVHKKEKTNQAKAFQEAGIKIIFNLLNNPENLQLSYRELAEIADVSIGSVSNVMNELEEQNFILKTKIKRVLKNKITLLERWVVAYQDVLRPRLVKKQMRFIKTDAAQNWKELYLDNEEGITLWGAEPAASIFTNHLIPEKFSIYTTQSWQNVGHDMGLVPDPNGKVEILQIFWKQSQTDNKKTTPPLLVYADLIGSGYGRNIETAQIILENELQHIK
ncbi:type IV toxin-antitoxin system AbiEi family antitoxin [uncultured Bacteroides sp.]|uniref:type IV toxin-antitoxin system AbiEi family antitoxin n=1 Tax=uncultured Bacteroides sp. TaxID=162156 RepID=UPI002AABAD09|nr:type IV toxin-antitoxin system AbiEi family antitoxin [uncultured Bacteroides sp.]